MVLLATTDSGTHRCAFAFSPLPQPLHSAPARRLQLPAETRSRVIPAPAKPEFRGLYKELIETNTAFSVGSCTLAAERMKARLVAAGYPESDLHLLVNPSPGRPQDGNLVADSSGTDPTQKAILLLAHIDVVEAKREDWIRDPFVLTENGGYFYARGASDDKAMAAIFTGLDGSLQAGGLQTHPHHQDDAQLRRGSRRPVHWRRLHGQEPPRPHRCGLRPERRRWRPHGQVRQIYLQRRAGR